MNATSIRSITVAGSGIVGLTAALAFARSLPLAKIIVIDAPADAASLADRMPTAWPTIGRVHALIGVDEFDLVSKGIATHHVGTVVHSANDRSWVHAFAPHGKPVGPVQFDQIWHRAQQAGQARDYASYSAGAVLARAGKFVHPPRDGSSPFSGFLYGLRLDPKLYRTSLRDRASAVNVTFPLGMIDRVETSNSRVVSVTLDSGMSIEADLFIDCTGPAGLLISKLDDSFEDWPKHKANCLVIDEVEGTSCSPAARLAFDESGWRGEWPLRDRTIRCAVGRDLPQAIAIRPGRRPRPWAGNVLAIGDAATAVEPLHGLNLDLAHRAILLALELLPDRDFSALELAEYNRRSAIMTDQIRDFIALHHAGDGEGCLPDSLSRRIDQYRHRGRLPFQEDEVLNREDWSAALIGLGIIPLNVDPAAAGVPLGRAVEAMEKIAMELETTVNGLPAYVDYLARIAGAR